MTPENNTSKSILNIVLKVVGIIVGTILVVLGASYVYWYYYVQKIPSESIIKDPQIIKTEPRIYTEQEKLQILNDLNTQNKTTVTLSDKEKFKILNTLKQSSPTTTLSQEEKLKILNSLSN